MITLYVTNFIGVLAGKKESGIEAAQFAASFAGPDTSKATTPGSGKLQSHL